MKCINCGHENVEGAHFCEECGVVLPTESKLGMGISDNQDKKDSNFNDYYQSQNKSEIVKQDYNSVYEMKEENLPSKFRPLSMWEYFGYQILFSIPIVGFVFLIYFSFFNNKNINRRNFARSYFCFIVICSISFLLLAACGVGAMMAGYPY